MMLKKPFLPALLLLLLVIACSSTTSIGSLLNGGAESPTMSATPVSTPVETTVETTADGGGRSDATMSDPATDPVMETTVPPLPTSTATSTPRPADLSMSATDVYIYPVPAIYAGDKVTFQILPFVPENVMPTEVDVRIAVDGVEIVNGWLGGRSHLSGGAVGLFEWAWDTAGWVGKHQIQINLDWQDMIWQGDENPDNNEVIIAVKVRDPETQPSNLAKAIWKMAESNCCQVHVVSGTAADRDLPELLEAVDLAIQQAVDRLGEPAQQRLDVYLIDRIIGQGGYAGSGMVVSYLDRDYAGNSLHQVLVHESVHLLDRQFAPQRIAFFAEGLAVWASGGHYKPEDINLCAAALLQTGRYIPLRQLINRFYPIQHEIGYLQAAGLVTYLIDNYGWSRFRAFYSEVTPGEAATLADAVDLKLKEHYGLSLDALESEWLSSLESLPWDRNDVLNVQITIRYYDLMRQYQLHYDPTAHFMRAWLPSPNSVQESGNPADLSGHPQTQLNVTLEVMLQAAGEAILAEEYNRANALLDSVERVLINQGQLLDPFAMNYWDIVGTASDMGYEVQEVSLTGDEARVVVSPAESSALTELNLVLADKEWILSN